MWVDTDPPDERWVPADGLPQLGRHVELHAYCERSAGRACPGRKQNRRARTASTCVPDLPRTMLVAVTISGPAGGAALGLAGILIGLWINGDRAERQRRRELHTRALNGCCIWRDAVHDPTPTVRGWRAKRRARTALHPVLRRQGRDLYLPGAASCGCDQQIAAAYNTLVESARQTAGGEATKAWKDPPLTTDPEMNMPELFDRLEPFRAGLKKFEADLARATLPRRRRVWR